MSSNMKHTDSEHPQTPNEQWNYIFIEGVKGIVDTMMSGRIEHPKTKENTKHLIKFVLTTHQLYRAALTEKINTQIAELKSRLLGTYRFRTEINTLEFVLHHLKNAEPKDFSVLKPYIK